MSKMDQARPEEIQHEIQSSNLPSVELDYDLSEELRQEAESSESASLEQNHTPINTLEPIETQLVQPAPPSHWIRTWLSMRLTTSETQIKTRPTSSIRSPQKISNENKSTETRAPEAIQSASSTWPFWSRVPTTKPESKSQFEPGNGGLSTEPQILVNMLPKNSTKAIEIDESFKPEISNSIDAETKSFQVGATEIKMTHQTLAQSQNPASNLLLPLLNSSYQVSETPSPSEKIARLFWFRQKPTTPHVYLSNEFPKLKRALAIGIHGLFPAPLLRTVIGQPTGTSIRFANHAAEAIRRWSVKNGSSGCEIQKIALESEGKILDRVEKLWKFLLDQIHEVRTSEFTLVACHSQGVPVAVMLVAKLLEFGAISTCRIGICAMGNYFLNEIKTVLTNPCSWRFVRTIFLLQVQTINWLYCRAFRFSKP